ncbi:54S ribosomal protein L25 [Fusarium oxysporum f. sp. albedinis]|nr:54S ribosomal protein L25 [Fusarium oxysporum f. sp. albedinis]
MNQSLLTLRPCSQIDLFSLCGVLHMEANANPYQILGYIGKMLNSRDLTSSDDKAHWKGISVARRVMILGRCARGRSWED